MNWMNHSLWIFGGLISYAIVLIIHRRVYELPQTLYYILLGLALMAELFGFILLSHGM